MTFLNLWLPFYFIVQIIYEVHEITWSELITTLSQLPIVLRKSGLNFFKNILEKGFKVFQADPETLMLESGKILNVYLPFFHIFILIVSGGWGGINNPERSHEQ